MGVVVTLTMLLAIQAGQAVDPVPAAPAPATDQAKPLVPFPHPLITEVLFAVPTSGGDANKDGTRHATGDEFIEITNPHADAINLAGYRLLDRHRGEEGRFAFTFPDIMLKPGQTVVVFNGLEAKWTGPVGDTHRAPPGPNPLFEGAFIFTAGVRSKFMALANTTDFVLLENALGVPVQVVVWGEPDQAPPAEAFHTDTISIVEYASVQRTSAAGPMVAHTRIELAQRAKCSPGVAFPKPPELSETEANPVDAPE
ncbi:MAG: lamin tail domain-containing protein [Phycisphaera sp.]|nr:MAG: lamin tail domain-containing protein [Phycisphaera sp.]